MSIEGIGILARILLQNPKVKALIDKGVSDFIDGFTKNPPTKAQKLEAISSLVEQMKNPTFADAFKTREDYFEFLLAVISQAAYLKERPLVLRDLYIQGYYFYFPQPDGDPSVIPAAGARVQPATARAIRTGPDTFYHFYAIPEDNDYASALKKLSAGMSNDPASSDGMNEWRDALSARVGLTPGAIIAVEGIGKATSAGHFIFIAPQDPTGDSDLKVTPSPQLRGSIVTQLEDFLKSPTF